jgi:hypothetical protein
MNRDLDRKNREVETASSRRETSSPLEGDSSRCSPEHGLPEGAGRNEPPSRDTRPDRATRFDFRAPTRKLSFQRFLFAFSLARHAGNGPAGGYICNQYR